MIKLLLASLIVVIESLTLQKKTRRGKLSTFTPEYEPGDHLSPSCLGVIMPKLAPPGQHTSVDKPNGL